ncbi:MAG: hypothetical protein ACR2FU_04385 [Streptosporangiaceae bacterium]
MRQAGLARSGSAALVFIAATGLLAVACGTAPEQPRVTPAPSISAARPVAAGPAPGSLTLAEAVAGRLVASMVFPPGAHAILTRSVPGQLRRPAEVPGSGHLVQRHEIRAVGRPASWVLAFLRRHRPAGLSEPGGGSSGLIARPVHFLMWSHRPQPGLYQAGLVVSVLAVGPGRSVVRADAQVIWYPPRSRAEYIRTGRFSAARLSGTLFNPRRRVVRRIITSRAVIARLAGTLNVLPADPGLQYGCPAMLAEYQVTFVPREAGQQKIVAVPDGCNSVGLTVGGRAEPGLTGGGATIALMSRLLGIGTAQPAARH